MFLSIILEERLHQTDPFELVNIDESFEEELQHL